MLSRQSTLATIIIAGSAFIFVPTAASTRAPQQAKPDVGQYAWAGACKTCHADIYASWERTKHANAAERLSKSEQEQDCIGCHTTGGAGKVERDGKFVSRGVQCEACHGPGGAHAADPFNKDTLSRVPSPQVCEACHNAKSPRFRGFVYQGMAKLSHTMTGK